jgi:hypothetical protein
MGAGEAGEATEGPPRRAGREGERAREAAGTARGPASRKGEGTSGERAGRASVVLPASGLKKSRQG